MNVPRTSEQKLGDYNRSKLFERRVLEHLPADVDVRTESGSELDFYVPSTQGHPYFLEVKEKAQRYGVKWQRLSGVEERNLFILDELSFRKARQCEDDHAAPAFFLLHDVPGGRMFLASCDDLSLVDRVRVDRVGATGHRKGKWIIDMSHLRMASLPGLHDTVQLVIEVSRKDWGWSECLTRATVPLT